MTRASNAGVAGAPAAPPELAKGRARPLLVFSVILAILAAIGAFEAGYLVANGDAVAEELASQDQVGQGGTPEIQEYFEPKGQTLVDDYRAYGVAMVVVLLTNTAVQAIACWQGVRSCSRRDVSPACETLGIGLLGLAGITLTLNTLAIGPELSVFLEAALSAVAALGYFLSARRLATNSFWVGIKEEPDTSAQEAAWLAGIKAQAAALPHEYRLAPDLMLEPAQDNGDGSIVLGGRKLAEKPQVDASSSGASQDSRTVPNVFPPGSEDGVAWRDLLAAPFAQGGESPSFCYLAVVSEEEFSRIAPIAAHLADDGDRDPEDVPVGHCRAYAFQACVAGTLGFPPSALAPHLPGAYRDVEAHFFLDGERLIFGTEDPEFVVLVNRYVKDQTYKKTSGGTALFEILEFLIDDGLMFLSDEETRLERLEDNMGEDLTEIPRDFDLFITHERRILGELTNFYRQYGDMASTLAHSRSAVIDGDDRALFGVLSDSSRHLEDDTIELREFALQLRGLYQSKIDVRQNKVMSILTVVTTIFMPLTLITGWFGMNFDVMPELHWEGSYYVVIALSFAVVTAEVIFFKHKKWF